MYLCYVDESGDASTLPSPTSPLQPVFVLVGLAIRQDSLRALTNDFLHLKAKFFPAHAAAQKHFLDNILWEVKGADLRRDVALGTHEERRHAIGFIDKSLDLLNDCHAKLFARVWIKGIGMRFDGTAVYTSSVQDICTTFQSMLAAEKDTGCVIADFRTKHTNALVSHSVFTQKYQTAGDAYDRLLEMPAFGHSDNHVGIQLADLLASALLFPMAVFTFCSGHVTNPTHVRPGNAVFPQRYGARLKAMQYRYQDTNLRWRGGITVCDMLGKRSGAALFKSGPALLPPITAQPTTSAPPPSPGPAVPAAPPTKKTT